MKRIKFLALAILPLIFIVACHQKDDINSPNNDDFSSAQFAVIDFLDLQNGIEDASLENDMTLNDPLFSMSFVGTTSNFGPGLRMLMGNPWFDKFDFNKNLGLTFRRLKLTDAQKEQIRGLMKTYHESVKGLFKEFREANAELVKAANAERKAIVDQIKAGTLTRETAKPLIQALNEKTRANIEANPASKAVKDKMCTARAALFSGIESILDTAQKEEWSKIVARIKNPC